MSYLPARKGRHRQRYTDHLRLVAGCIPYRLENDTEESRISVLMISTPNRDDLVFPKGGWEDDETVHEAACREALEEAGVKGILDEDPLECGNSEARANRTAAALKVVAEVTCLPWSAGGTVERDEEAAAAAADVTSWLLCKPIKP
ncbi:Nudix hydrolase 12 [Hibiscus syriacus]|uniref:Nudix hydrolase 12 n=1 Tax=Hibiscus syriacus TaxID=106335 RepID=A0A6A2ZLZ2_HIBSY|nr:Nudix hydrolase 12 [Hibiscus syriacus]